MSDHDEPIVRIGHDLAAEEQDRTEVQIRYTWEKIAKVLDIPITTAKTDCEEILQRLLEKLEDDPELQELWEKEFIK